MTTVGNTHTHGEPGLTRGNAHIPEGETEQSVTNPTLANADGTYDMTFSSVRGLNSTDDVVGVEWSGDHKTSVSSVSGNTVSVLFQSPSGTDTFTNEADGALTGTLTVTVKN